MSNEGVFDEAIGGFVCNFGESVKEASAVNMQVLYCTNVGTVGLARRAEFIGDDGASLPRASRHVTSIFTPCSDQGCPKRWTVGTCAVYVTLCTAFP